MAVIRRPFPTTTLPQHVSPLRATGLFLIFFGGLLGPVILYATPIGCIFVGAIQVLIFGFMFLLGVGLLIASFLHRRNKQTQIQP